MSPSLSKVLCLTLLAAVAVAGCERKEKAPAAAPTPAVEPAPAAPPALEGFQHDASFDAQGFYIPAEPIKVGALALKQVAFGAPSDFKQWEAGEREAVFGPIILQFEDESSPTATNELGQEVHQITVRVLPTAYRVFPAAISFRATDPKLGEIGFVGAIDQATLNSARDNGSSAGKVVMTGTLRIGGAFVTIDPADLIQRRGGHVADLRTGQRLQRGQHVAGVQVAMTKAGIDRIGVSQLFGIAELADLLDQTGEGRLAESEAAIAAGVRVRQQDRGRKGRAQRELRRSRRFPRGCRQ